MILGSAASMPSQSIRTGCVTESSQLPSQVTRASMSPERAAPETAGRRRGPGEDDLCRVVGAPRVAEEDHRGRVATVLGRVRPGELDRAGSLGVVRERSRRRVGVSAPPS